MFAQIGARGTTLFFSSGDDGYVVNVLIVVLSI